MTRCKTQTKLQILSLILAILVLSLPSLSFAAPGITGIDMEVKGGYDDTAVVGSYAPFGITLLSKGEDFSGELQVIVSVNPEGKSIYAVPVTLPRGSNKVISVSAPVTAVNKNVEVRLVKGGKTIKSVDYKFKKLISPETPIIGILCEDANGFTDLNGIKLTENINSGNSALAQKIIYSSSSAMIQSSYPAVQYQGGRNLSDRPAEIIYLDEKTMPDNLKALNAFNVLIISNFDTSALSDKQVNALNTWVDDGRSLFLGTGPNWKKVYSGLINDLKPFKIENSTTISTSANVESFTDAEKPLEGLNIVTGSAGSGNVLLEENDLPLAVTYEKWDGSVSVLAFDPTLSPFHDWIGNKAFWKKLINEVKDRNSASQNFQQVGYPVRLSNIFAGATSNVPDNQTPPYRFLLLISAVYIVIVGPLIYLLLKWKDKRDWNWIAIPAFALLFMGIIYIAGFKTRFNTAVLNSVSVINLDQESRTTQITSYMGVFNNKTGAMEIAYAEKLNLDMDANRYYNYGYVSNSANNSSRIISKYTLGSTTTLEVYDTHLWESRFLNATKTEPLTGGLLTSFTINDGILKAVIRNNTRYDFKESFIALGNNFIEVGDIPGGEEKTVEISLSGSKVRKNFDEFLNDRYVQSYSGGSRTTKLPADWRDKNRKREILGSYYQNIISQDNGKSKLFLCAFNNDNPGYDLVINNKEPKSYNINIIYSSLDFRFVKGEAVEIPSGIVRASLVYGDDTGGVIEQVQDNSTLGVIRQTDGNVDFSVKIPDDIEVRRLTVSFRKYLQSYLKNRQQGVPRQVLPNNTYKYYIYNNKTSNWEEKGEKFTVASGMDSYTDSSGSILLRTNVVLDKSAPKAEFLGYPDIEISGVAK